MTVIRSVVIGRGEGCDLVIRDDEYVSPRHARIDQHENGLFTIEDIGSTNGTWIRRAGRGMPAKIPLGGRDFLRVGDVVRIGRTEIPWNGVRQADAEAGNGATE